MGWGWNDFVEAVSSVVANTPDPNDPFGGINLSDVLNIPTQFYSVGTVGLQDGKVGKGAIVRQSDEMLGEITGRNMARDQKWMNEKRIAAEEARRAQMLADEANQRRQEDIAASYGAQGIRNTAGSRSNRMLRFQALGEEQDFLGL
jgi:hypothetical protein